MFTKRHHHRLKKTKRTHALRLLGVATAVLLLSLPFGYLHRPGPRPAAEQPDPEQAEVQTLPGLSAADAAVPRPQDEASSAENAPAPEVQGPALPEVQGPPAPAIPMPEPSAVDGSYFADAVFLGDSRTEGLALYGGPSAATYLSSVGATVESIGSKPVSVNGGRKAPLLDTMRGIPCKKIYIMLGVNELGWVNTDTYRNQFSKVLDRIIAEHPDAVIALQSLLPVSAAQDAKGSYVNNERIRTYNGILQELAQEKGCVFLDVARAVTGPDGCLPQELTPDGIHLTPKGCSLWTQYLLAHPL